MGKEREEEKEEEKEEGREEGKERMVKGREVKEETAEIHTVSRKMARWRNRVQRAINYSQFMGPQRHSS